jgi:hypothetical protein
MFDKHIICDDSLSNITEHGEVAGFSFLARLPYYRGLGLSMVEDLSVTVDGEAMPRDAIRFEVRGRRWTLDEMETEYGDRWNFGEKATVIVLKPGGLAPGKHVLQLSERMRISYLPFVPTTSCEKELLVA